MQPFLLASLLVAAVLGAAPLLKFDAFYPQRTLLFSNHPEPIAREYLAEAGVVLYRTNDDIRGPVRAWYEHLNWAGATISFGVYLYNPNKNPVNILVTGRGFTNKWNGGIPFVELFTPGFTPEQILVPGQSGKLLLQQDGIRNNTLTTGVVDFEVQATTPGAALTTVRVSFVAFVSSKSVTPDLPQIPYFIPGHSQEMLCYKGSSPVSDVQARQLNFVVSDSTPSGALPVAYSAYDMDSQTFLEPVERTPFTSHIGPANTPAAVVLDNIALLTPGWGYIHVLAKSDGNGGYPNWGNWAVTYHLYGSVTNQGKRDRLLQFRMGSPGDSPLAFQNSNGTWDSVIVEHSQGMSTLYQTPLPAGQTVPFAINYVMGGPGYGALTNEFLLQ
ncbi:hypothetical protein PAPYR_1220 [Paratrimastix pyriformis]|uniref:Uncharacterized protein n=1 Tax=Paratrimastix pyriformis TaxID=342808 RepID=A0ABQ8UU40_9EUKA|nr:hypothetical protein PAPYR_1220 [Paratrimastix pyriformis]